VSSKNKKPARVGVHITACTQTGPKEGEKREQRKNGERERGKGRGGKGGGGGKKTRNQGKRGGKLKWIIAESQGRWKGRGGRGAEVVDGTPRGRRPTSSRRSDWKNQALTKKKRPGREKKD